MKNILPLLFIIFLAITSCNKIDDVKDSLDPKAAALNFLQNQWDWDFNIDYNYVGASTAPDYNDTSTIAGDYINFKGDNTADIKIGGQTDNVPYELISENELKFDGDTFTITSISANQLIFKYEERTSTPWFDNVNTLSR